MKTINYLLGYQDLKIVQDSECFQFSLDSILLPNFVTLNPTIKKILDIGCGNAPIPLILSTKTKAQITGIEIQKKIAQLAQQSISLNHLDSQIEIIHADVKAYPFASESFDVVVCNPPFFKVGKQSHLNNSDAKSIARHELYLNASDVFALARKVLRNQGIIAMVHRPERLVDLLVEMRKQNLEPKKIQYVYPNFHENSHILLVEGKKNGKPGLKILPPLYVHEEDGSYTRSVQAFFSNIEK